MRGPDTFTRSSLSGDLEGAHDYWKAEGYLFMSPRLRLLASLSRASVISTSC